ncbi:hypothetical protein AUEXF2481DRAFT_463549 [Aureobasidium subglaciale EXF-2481]|uniref:Uncharacterized protein n=1 Tax=Aureobasidium subglaciale (strain EXF-2481) TaxID=1043005 RepID=A0A074Y607_AURSE|nr:uncharacterized protein AUEXF2481DRAFT_463549 [Aureobasidium subglaciale EXF-2481]KEQ91414.1 hypothetical protein AUEXF2481DRAFT_463549 [Aureobasidium subglaciale EXF-2481]
MLIYCNVQAKPENRKVSRFSALDNITVSRCYIFHQPYPQPRVSAANLSRNFRVNMQFISECAARTAAHQILEQKRVMTKGLQEKVNFILQSRLRGRSRPLRCCQGMVARLVVRENSSPIEKYSAPKRAKTMRSLHAERELPNSCSRCERPQQDAFGLQLAESLSACDPLGMRRSVPSKGHLQLVAYLQVTWPVLCTPCLVLRKVSRTWRRRDL